MTSFRWLRRSFPDRRTTRMASVLPGPRRAGGAYAPPSPAAARLSPGTRLRFRDPGSMTRNDAARAGEGAAPPGALLRETAG